LSGFDPYDPDLNKAELIGWEALEVSSNKRRITFQLTFRDALYVSAGGNLCRVKVRFGDGLLFVTARTGTALAAGTEYSKEINRQSRPGAKRAKQASRMMQAVLEFLASAGPIVNFMFGFGMSNLWSMLEGMQVIVHYPMMDVIAPSNLELVQAAMRKIATFEVIDGDLIKEHIWGYEKEEKLEYYLLACGYDSHLILFTYGLPLYFITYNLILLVALPLINRCRGPIDPGTEPEPEAALEGGDEEECDRKR